MARIYTIGFEWGREEAECVLQTGFTGGYLATNAARTGSWGVRKAFGDANALNMTFNSDIPRDTTIFFRAYFKKNANPASQVPILGIGRTGGIPASIELKADGTLVLEAPDGTLIGSPSSALSNTTWYRIELMIELATGANDKAELRLDGATVSSIASANLDNADAGLLHNFFFQVPPSGSIWDWDDVAINDEFGATQNSWPGEGKIILLRPVSDAQLGSWTGGAGGTTNLFEAINNVPPVGTASETDLTQIECADSSGSAEYRATTATYDSVLVASDVINSVTPSITHGEDAGAGTKTGTIACISNPGGSPAGFTFGNDVGALGTFPATTWIGFQASSASVNSPSVTRNQGAVIGVRKTDTGTRVVSVCAFGLYVDYTPATSFDYLDSATITLDLQASGSELEESVEAATVPMAFSASAVETREIPDAATVLLDLQASGTELQEREVLDSATVLVDLQVTATESTDFSDSATVLVDLQVATVETTDTVDSNTVLFDLQASGTDIKELPDAATVPFDLQVTSAEVVDWADATTVLLDLQVTGTDLHEIPDAATVLLDLQASAVEQADWLDSANIYVDLQASGLEVREITDTATVLFALTVSAVEQYIPPLVPNVYAWRPYIVGGTAFQDRSRW